LIGIEVDALTSNDLELGSIEHRTIAFRDEPYCRRDLSLGEPPVRRERNGLPCAGAKDSTSEEIAIVVAAPVRQLEEGFEPLADPLHENRPPALEVVDKIEPEPGWKFNACSQHGNRNWVKVVCEGR
jgi:hypothetical protein